MYGVLQCVEFIISRGWYEKREGTPTWDNSYQLKPYKLPIILCGICMGVANVGEGRW